MTNAWRVSDAFIDSQAGGVPAMIGREIAMAVAGGSLTIVGAYIMAKPRRLFMFEDDRAEYRPTAVPIDSAQGRWLVKAAPAYLVIGVLLFIGALL